MPSVFHSDFWYFVHKIVTKYCSPTFCAGLELLLLTNAGLKPAGRGGGCWGSSSQLCRWDWSSPKPTREPQVWGHGRVFFPNFNPEFPMDYPGCGQLLSLGIVLLMCEATQNPLWHTHLWVWDGKANSMCRGTHQEAGRAWGVLARHCLGPGEAAESQQRLPGLCPMEILYFPGLWAVLSLVSLADLEPGNVTASAGPALRKRAANFVRTIFGDSEAGNAWAQIDFPMP